VLLFKNQLLTRYMCSWDSIWWLEAAHATWTVSHLATGLNYVLHAMS